MNRSQPLTRRTGLSRSVLARRSPLRSRVRPRTPESGREAWKAPRWGRCAMCNRWGRLVRHHVVTERHVRASGGDPWALSNSMDLGSWCSCHARHHSGFARIPVDRVPMAARDFAVRLLGQERAEAYFQRYYGPGRGEV